jgi:hypothetical protein
LGVQPWAGRNAREIRKPLVLLREIEPAPAQLFLLLLRGDWDRTKLYEEPTNVLIGIPMIIAAAAFQAHVASSDIIDKYLETERNAFYKASR